MFSEAFGRCECRANVALTPSLKVRLGGLPLLLGLGASAYSESYGMLGGSEMVKRLAALDITGAGARISLSTLDMENLLLVGVPAGVVWVD